MIEINKDLTKIAYSLAVEDFGMKDCFLQMNLSDSRIMFRERCSCLTSCQFQFSSKWEFIIKNKFECPMCQEREVEQYSHWHTCSFYEEMRKKLKRNDEKSLVEYYRQIIKIRQEQEIH